MISSLVNYGKVATFVSSFSQLVPSRAKTHPITSIAVTVLAGGSYALAQSYLKEQAKLKYERALRIYNGCGVPKDHEKAFKLFTEAARYGQPEQMIAWMLYRGEGTPQDLKRAFELFERLAEEGDEYAEKQVAWMLYRGEGTPQDLKRAFRIFKKYANQWHVLLQEQVAWMLYRGEGVEQDLEQAFGRFEELTNLPSYFAPKLLKQVAWMLCRGEGTPQDLNRAFAIFKTLAEREDVEAQYEVGRRLCNGIGTEKDQEQGKWFLEQAAHRFYEGNGVEKDLNRAFLIYRMLAGLGHVRALYIAGNLLYTGRGIEQDREQGLQFIEQAASAQFSNAFLFLGQIHEQMGPNYDLLKSLEYYRRAKAADPKVGSLAVRSIGL